MRESDANECALGKPRLPPKPRLAPRELSGLPKPEPRKSLTTKVTPANNKSNQTRTVRLRNEENAAKLGKKEAVSKVITKLVSVSSFLTLLL